MLNITVIELLVLIVILPVIGGVIGYVVASDRMRGGSGGKTPAELQAELETYQQGVNNHFEHTADLLQQMTAQYRSIYTHMAHGAAELCGEGATNPQIEELKRLSLALDDAAAVPPAEQAPGDPQAKDADADANDGAEQRPTT